MERDRKARREVGLTCPAGNHCWTAWTGLKALDLPGRGDSGRLESEAGSRPTVGLRSTQNSNMNAPESDSESESFQAPTVHYLLAHRVLPDFAFSRPKDLFGVLASPQRGEVLEQVCQHLDQQLGEASTRDFQGTDIQVFPVLIQQRAALIVQMPPPQNSVEAVLVVVLSELTPEQLELAMKDPEQTLTLRYLTFERPTDVEDSEGTIFCEWTPDRHLNFGFAPVVDAPSALTFLEARDWS